MVFRFDVALPEAPRVTKGDVRSQKGWAALVGRVGDEFRHLDVLVNKRLRHQSRNTALQAFVGGEPPSPAVAQTVGFGLGKSEILYLSRGID